MRWASLTKRSMSICDSVTLKVISEKYVGDESARLRFLREARAAAKVRHSNVASVFHLGRSGGNYFYAMEFVEGETLESSSNAQVGLRSSLRWKSHAGRRRFGRSRRTEPGSPGHQTNQHHGRVEGRSLVTAKIIDLGLAKTVDDSASEAAISVPGAFAGTPEFASPEQFAGVRVDIRSDLYSLGVTLWEMLTGRAPFRGSPSELMYQHQHAAVTARTTRKMSRSLSSSCLRRCCRRIPPNARRAPPNSKFCCAR